MLRILPESSPVSSGLVARAEVGLNRLKRLISPEVDSAGGDVGDGDCAAAADEEVLGLQEFWRCSRPADCDLRICASDVE
jgi:hypothetical protein